MISVNPELSKNGFFSAPRCLGPQLGRWTARGNSTAGGWTHLEASSQTCSSHCGCGLGLQLGLLIREPTRIPYALGFLASWKPQGHLVSPMDFQGFKCESPCKVNATLPFMTQPLKSHPVTWAILYWSKQS